MYLENSKETNISFYGRFGFQVRQQMTHRRNGPSMWLMWRDPLTRAWLLSSPGTT